MSEMPDLQPRSVAGNAARHINGDSSVYPASLYGTTEPGIAPDLFGHGKDMKLVFIGSGFEKTGIFFNRIQIQNKAV
jgi:hypothetical protein